MRQTILQLQRHSETHLITDHCNSFALKSVCLGDRMHADTARTLLQPATCGLLHFEQGTFQ